MTTAVSMYNPISLKQGTSFQMFLLQWFVHMLSICAVYAITCTSNVEKQ